MLRRTILAVSVLTLSACGGGGGGSTGGATPTGGTTTPTPDKFEVTGNNQTTTLNKTSKIAAYISGSNNTVYIQSSLTLLEVSGSNNVIEISNGVTVDKCSIVGINNAAKLPKDLKLSCDISGLNNTGF